MNKAARVSHLFEGNVLQQVKEMFVKKLHRNKGLSNDCFGIESDHVLWSWFYKNIFHKIEMQFSENIKPIFVMYMHAVVPFQVHSDDYWHKEKNLPGKPFVSFLIPISVDNDLEQTHKASTIVFNETKLDGEKSNNALQYYDSFLSHCDKTKLKQITIKEKFDWSVGDLIYWDSCLQHTSSDFQKFSSKQSLVGHTYIV